MKKIVTKFLPMMLCCIFIVQHINAAEEIYDVNFALTSNGASATASSEEHGGAVAGNAIDGNEGSAWSSAYNDPTTADDQTWTLDLGQERVFNTIEFVWQTAYAKDFTISISSDNLTWQEVIKVEDQVVNDYEVKTHKIDKTTARYIQFHGTERATVWGFSFREFRVLLPGESVLTTMQLNPATPTAKIGTNITLTLVGKDQNGAIMSDFGTPEYTVTPAEAGQISGNNYIPAQIGKATITAQVGTVTTSCEVVAYEGENLALSADGGKVIDHSFEVANEEAEKALDGIINTQGWRGRPSADNTGGDEASRTYDAWFTLDLGDFYDINMVIITFENAASQKYHVDFSMDNVTWNHAFNYDGPSGFQAHTDYIYGASLQNNTKVRYVRFLSTMASTQYGVFVHEFQVYGTEWQDTGDTNPPTMGTAEVVSTTYTSAVLSVSATDAEGEVWGYRVANTTPAWQKFCEPDANGQITITGLAAGDYTVSIKAVDAANNESENSVEVSFNIPVQEIEEVNFALKSNGSTAIATSQEDAAKAPNQAIDGNSESIWSSAFSDDQTWTLDLGQLRIFNTIQIEWNPDAFSKAYTISVSKDNAQWTEVVNITGQAILSENTQTHNITKTTARYIQFYATERASIYGHSFREFRVYLSGASILTTMQATPAENVIKIGNSTAITVVGKDQHGIVMNEIGIVEYTITPVDAGHITNNTYYPDKAGVASIVAKIGSVVAPAFEVTAYEGVDKPTSAPTPPSAREENMVKSLYSDIYGTYFSADAGWPNAPTFEELTFDEDHIRYYTNFTDKLGWAILVGKTPINANAMEKLHLDIWTNVDATIDIIPINFINGVADDNHSKTVTLHGQQWNTIDLTLATDFAGLELTSINQFKFANPTGASIFAIDNVYFYRETALPDDTEAPTNFNCEINAQSYTTINITCSAEDASEFVTFEVMLGAEKKASANVASGESVTMTLTNLAPDSEYNFVVWAIDLYGNKTSTTVTHKTEIVVIDENIDLTQLPNGTVCDATFNRTMVVSEGVWNTIALPFAMTNEQIQSTFGNGTKVAKLQSTSTVASISEINMVFSYVNAIEAGTPYIILPKNTGNGVVIEDVKIDVEMHDIVVAGQVTMHPVLKTISYNYSNGDPIKFFLSPDGNLHYNESTNSIKAMRAYFTFDNVTSVAAASQIRARVVFNENTATGVANFVIEDNAPIKIIENGQIIIVRNGEKYNIQGQKL